MPFYETDKMPTLVRMARTDFAATRLVLERLKAEDGESRNMTTLLCLCLECGNASFAYGQLDAKQYLGRLLLLEEKYDDTVLMNRLGNMFVPKFRFFEHKLKACILFKEFRRLLNPPRYEEDI